MIVDPISAVRPLLPAWVTWAPLLLSLTMAAVTGLAARLAAWPALRAFERLPCEAHWTERARLAMPARRRVAAAAATFAVLSAFLPAGGPISLPPAPLHAALNFVLQLGAAAWAALSVERRLVPAPSLRERIRSLLAWTLVLYPHLLAAILIAYVEARSSPASPGLVVAAALAVTWLALGGGFRIGRALGLVARAPERLARALERARDGSAGEPPALVELPIVAANAYAFPLLGAVGVTTGALRALDDEQLAAVLRHELAHLAEGRATKGLRALNTALLPVAVVVAPTLASLHHGLPAVALVWGVLLLFVATRRLQQRLETRADQAAHVDAPAYARALEDLHRESLVPATLGRRASHPDLYDRLVAAGAPPAWPRPSPPPRGRGWAIAMTLLVAGGTVAATTARHWLPPDDPDDLARYQLAAALSQSASDLGAIGRIRFERQELDAAATLYAAAATIDPSDALYPAVEALALSLGGRCREARGALARAEAARGEREYVEEVRAEVEDCEEAP
jgi:Zn-dependent protease with chaperone function